MVSVLSRISKENIFTYPFPYVVIDNALDQDLYKQLELEYPFEYRIDGYSGYANNTRYQISVVDGLRGNRLSPLWKEFVAYHTSKDFYNEVRKLFKKDIEKYYPNLMNHSNVGVRFRDVSANIWMDCQPGINSPVTKNSSVKGPHLDNERELYGGLLYFKHPEDTSSGGDLVVYKKKVITPPFYGARFVKEKYLEQVATVPYAPNRLVFFLNTPDSIHGVSVRSVTPYTRRLVNFIGEVNEPLFNIVQPAGKIFTKILNRFVAPISKGIIN